jgi:hypothetical protein
MNILEDYRDYILPEDIEALNMAIDALKEEPKSKVIAQINVDADEVVKLIERNCNYKQPKGQEKG